MSFDTQKLRHCQVVVLAAAARSRLTGHTPILLDPPKEQIVPTS